MAAASCCSPAAWARSKVRKNDTGDAAKGDVLITVAPVADGLLKRGKFPKRGGGGVQPGVLKGERGVFHAVAQPPERRGGALCKTIPHIHQNHAVNLIVKFCPDGRDFKPFNMKGCSSEERRTAVRLLDLGIIRCVCPVERTYRYEWTDFGKHCYLHPNRE